MLPSLTAALVAGWATMPALCLDTKHAVAELPGVGAPPTRHWTGFVETDATSETHLFYYFVESQRSPSSDPLVWWFNGGPGASSLAGLFSENGPFLLNDAGALVANPYAWNSEANVLYVEFGPGIGYSYCANSSKGTDECPQSSGDCSPCLSDDSSVASQNARFLAGFLELFPSLKGRPLYLTGESYAGVYGPLLARAIVDAFDDTSVANLSGVWLTDPCVDDAAQSGWLDVGPTFLYESGLIDEPLFTTLTSPGCTTGFSALGDRFRNTSTVECRGAWRLYDIAYAGIGDAVQPAPIPGVPMYVDPLNALGPSGGPDLQAFVASLRGGLNANQSLNEVYHLELGNNGYVGYETQYAACNPNPQGPHADESMLDVYRELLASRKPSASSLARVLVSSGDVDTVVNLKGTEKAMRALGFPGGPRLPWFYNTTATDAATILHKPAAWGSRLVAVDVGAQVAGYHVDYDTAPSAVAFEFLTFKDSGHMVPAYAPQRALHVLAKLLAGAPITPPLPAGWQDADDAAFYARDTRKKGGDATPGIFATWVAEAMSADYV